MTVQQEDNAIGFKPLYAQVRDQLVRRLVDRTWQPGMTLPSEQELARQLNVSQGTVRKALDSMTADNLLVRQQGRGTFVAEPEDSRILFQFFRLTADDAGTEDVFPESKVLGWSGEEADGDQAIALGVTPGAPVWSINRIRQLAGKTVLTETVTIPAAAFPGFEDLDAIPNNVYQLYSSRWGITIARADEKLKAIIANADDAGHLGCETGTPLLCVTRIAYDLEDRPVELRISRCLTGDMHYAASLP